MEKKEMNIDFIPENKNNDLKKVRKIFMSNFKIGEAETTRLNCWLADLKEKINKQIVLLKETQSNQLNSEEMKEFLTSFAANLEEYFEESVGNIEEIAFNGEPLSKLKNFIKQNPIEGEFVGFNRYNEHVAMKYDAISSDFEELNKILLEKLRTQYDLYNI